VWHEYRGIYLACAITNTAGHAMQPATLDSLDAAQDPLDGLNKTRPFQPAPIF
jgi:hypothetical protein